MFWPKYSACSLFRSDKFLCKSTLPQKLYALVVSFTFEKSYIEKIGGCMRSLLLLLCLTWTGWAQNNVLDLRPAEWNEQGQVTYRNFIYSRYLAGGRFMFNAVHIRIPPASYKELAVGAGYNAVTLKNIHAYIIANLATATDDYYLEPSLFVIGNEKRWSGSFLLVHYVPLGQDGISQWLMDPFEVQYRVLGPLAAGFSSYYYQADGGEALTKAGVKLSYGHRYGAIEAAFRHVNHYGGTEFQLRTLFLF
jgi:hypothetical protein